MRPVLFLVTLLALALGGCSIYKQDIQQGNVVTREMYEQLKPGMTRAQVRFALGSPLIADPFHADRWDYLYYFLKGGADKPEIRRLILHFRGDTLQRIEGEATAPADLAVKP